MRALSHALIGLTRNVHFPFGGLGRGPGVIPLAFSSVSRANRSAFSRARLSYKAF